MIRSTCQHCHGLDFSLDSLIDVQLINNNFKGRAKHHVQTMDLAEQEAERRKQKNAGNDDADMFGF